jgi:transcriptional regulator with XRE-family HTH domain
MRKKTDFDRYLEEQLKDKDFADRFRIAGQAWEVAMQLAALRKKSGLTQKDLAERVGTSQQQISRLESISYDGHSLSMLRRVAETLGATVKVEIQSKKNPEYFSVAEKKAFYRVKKRIR